VYLTPSGQKESKDLRSRLAKINKSEKKYKIKKWTDIVLRD